MPSRYAENPNTGEWVKSVDGGNWEPVPAWEGKIASMVRQHDVLVPSALETAGQVGGGLLGSLVGPAGSIGGGIGGYGIGRELSRALQDWAGGQVRPESETQAALKDIGGGAINELLGAGLAKGIQALRGTLTSEGAQTVQAFKRTGVPLYRWEVPGTGEKFLGKALTSATLPSAVLHKAEEKRGLDLEKMLENAAQKGFGTREDAGKALIDTMNLSLEKQKGEFNTLYRMLDPITDHPPTKTLEAVNNVRNEINKSPTLMEDYISSKAANDILENYATQGGMRGIPIQELRAMRSRLRSLSKRAAPDDRRMLNKIVSGLTSDMEDAARTHGLLKPFQTAELRYNAWNRMRETPVMKELGKYGVFEDPESGAITGVKDLTNIPSLPGKNPESFRNLLQMMKYSPQSGKIESNPEVDHLLRRIMITHHLHPPGGMEGLTAREKSSRVMQMLRSPTQAKELRPKELKDIRRVLSHLSTEKSAAMGGNPSGTATRMAHIAEAASIPALILQGDYKTLGGILGTELLGGAYAKHGTNPQAVLDFINKMDPSQKMTLFQKALNMSRPAVSVTTSLLGNVATEQQ